MRIQEILTETAKPKEAPKPRNWVAKNAQKATGGAGAHKDKKKAAKQGDVKHKGQTMAEEAAGVGIVTKQNATVDVPVGGEYMNVKKLFPKKKKKAVKEAQWTPKSTIWHYNRGQNPEHGKVNPTDPSLPVKMSKRPPIEDPEDDQDVDVMHPSFKDEPDMDTKIFSQQVSDWLDNHKKIFTKAEWYTLKLRFENEATIEDIAKSLGITKERVRTLEAKALRKLRADKDFVAAFDPKNEGLLDEEPASRALCQSGKPDSALGASQLASCKSQGYRARDGGKSHKVGNDRVKVRGKKIKGKKYGGPLPDWS